MHDVVGSGTSSIPGTGLDRMNLSIPLPYDAAYASDLFSAVRVKQPTEAVQINNRGVNLHCVTMWATGTDMFDVSFNGNARSDAIMPPGITAVSTAHSQSQYCLGPHKGFNFSFYIDPNHFERTFQDDDPAGRCAELNNDLCTGDPFFRQMMHAYLREVENAREFSQIALQSIALQVSLHLARNYSTLVAREVETPRTLMEKRRIARAKEYIQDNLARPISLAEIAGAAHLSQYHFVRCFKAAEGVTPYQFVIQKRLEMARHMVTETKHSLVEIADMCGFSSQQHLTDAYGKAFGVTPGAMRRRLAS